MRINLHDVQFSHNILTFIVIVCVTLLVSFLVSYNKLLQLCHIYSVHVHAHAHTFTYFKFFLLIDFMHLLMKLFDSLDIHFFPILRHLANHTHALGQKANKSC